LDGTCELDQKRIIVALTGASGATYGLRLLQVLKDLNVETHGIMTHAAEANLRIETSFSMDDVLKLCSYRYDESDVGARLASGSYITDGMVIVPCSTRTLAGVAHGLSDNLVLRAAEVCLKEKRRLVLVPRETPLNVIHIRNMLSAAEAGAIILPAMPGFYHQPKTINDMVDHVVGKILDAFGIEHSLFKRWTG
jgi:4-hydroxy-3-polyprenylbenzoate decarboxylase